MYNNNLYVTLFFSFMWLAVVAGSVTSTQGVTLVPLGTTHYCTNGSMDEYVVASGVIPLVNDTLIFVAMTWRLVRGSRRGSIRTGGLWSFIFGRHLPAFSRSLLQDGQAYYLLSDFKLDFQYRSSIITFRSTVGLAFVTVTFITVKSIPTVYRSAIGIPDIMLINVMACRVFRNTKFGIFKETTSNFVLPMEIPDLSITFNGDRSSTPRNTFDDIGSGDWIQIIETSSWLLISTPMAWSWGAYHSYHSHYLRSCVVNKITANSRTDRK